MRFSASATSWLQFLAVLAFIGILGIRAWPFAQLPHRLSIVPPTYRPLAYLTLGSAAALLFSLFVAIPSAAGTMVDSLGPLGVLLAVFPIALCCAVALANSVDETQRTFVGVLLLAYAGPELYFMLGSLLLGDQFTYLGNTVGGSGLSAGWFVVIQATLLATLTASTFRILRQSEVGPTDPALRHR